MEKWQESTSYERDLGEVVSDRMRRRLRCRWLGEKVRPRRLIVPDLSIKEFKTPNVIHGGRLIRPMERVLSKRAESIMQRREKNLSATSP